MPRNYYVSGGFNVICDSCGKKIKASEAKQRWDGLIVCPEDFEQRQPQDFVKARADKITVPFTRPRPTDVFILTQGINDPIVTTDILSASIDWNRFVDDTVTITDIFSTDRNFTFEDLVYALDYTGLNYIDPTYFLQDYIQDLGGFSIFVGKSSAEAITVVDTIAKNLELSESDSASLIEYVMDAYHKQTSDAITLSDLANQIAAFNRSSDDSVGVADSFAQTTQYSRSIDDSFSLSDSIDIYKAILVAYFDTVTMSDNFNKAATYLRSVSDSVAMSDSSHVVPNKRPADSISLTDSGNILYNGYIDPTYFASDYVGSWTNF